MSYSCAARQVGYGDGAFSGAAAWRFKVKASYRCASRRSASEWRCLIEALSIAPIDGTGRKETVQGVGWPVPSRHPPEAAPIRSEIGAVARWAEARSAAPFPCGVLLLRIELARGVLVSTARRKQAGLDRLAAHWLPPLSASRPLTPARLRCNVAAQPKAPSNCPVRAAVPSRTG